MSSLLGSVQSATSTYGQAAGPLAFSENREHFYVSFRVPTAPGVDSVGIDVFETATGTLLQTESTNNGFTVGIKVFQQALYITDFNNRVTRFPLNEAGLLASTEGDVVTTFNGYTHAAVSNQVGESGCAVYFNPVPPEFFDPSYASNGLLVFDVNQPDASQWITAPADRGMGWGPVGSIPNNYFNFGVLPKNAEGTKAYTYRYNDVLEKDDINEFDVVNGTSRVLANLPTQSFSDQERTDGDLQDNNITNILVHGGNIFVSNTRESSVYILDLEGNVQSVIGPIDTTCPHASYDHLHNECELGPAVVMNGKFYQLLGGDWRTPDLFGIPLPEGAGN